MPFARLVSVVLVSLAGVACAPSFSIAGDVPPAPPTAPGVPSPAGPPPIEPGVPSTNRAIALQGHGRLVVSPFGEVVERTDHALQIRVSGIREAAPVLVPAEGAPRVEGIAPDDPLRFRFNEAVMPSPYTGPWLVHDHPGFGVPLPEGYAVIAQEGSLTGGRSKALLRRVPSGRIYPFIVVVGGDDPALDLDGLAAFDGLIADHRTDAIPWVEVRASPPPGLQQAVWGRKVGEQTVHVVATYDAAQAASVQRDGAWVAANLVATQPR